MYLCVTIYCQRRERGYVCEPVRGSYLIKERGTPVFSSNASSSRSCQKAGCLSTIDQFYIKIITLSIANLDYIIY